MKKTRLLRNLGYGGGGMLRSIRIKNWKSIYDEVLFSMLATREQRHSWRLARVSRERILPVSAIYGGNASGKTSFVDAIGAIQSFVIDERYSSELLPFVSNRQFGSNEPTEIGIEFAVSDGSNHSKSGTTEKIFYYEVVANSQRVIKEELVWVRSKTEELVFTRNNNDVLLYGELAESRTAKALTDLIGSNQSFFGQLCRPKQEDFEVPDLVTLAYSWFANTLIVIQRDARYIPLPQRLKEDEIFNKAMVHGLAPADTGIKRIEFEEVSQKLLPLSEDALAELERHLIKSDREYLSDFSGSHYVLSLDKNHRLKVERMIAVHGSESQQEDEFKLLMSEESDGTKRFMHLLPILLELTHHNSRAVIVIDELEHSMHPKLTEHFVEQFLEDLTQDDRRQLIFTTHEVQLMSSDLLRRDEMWITEKNDFNTEMWRVSDFSSEGIRKGSDLLKYYMTGVLGGTPRL